MTLVRPTPPPGAIGVCGAEGPEGYLIGWRQALRLPTGEPISHVIRHVGAGIVTDAAFRRGVTHSFLSDARWLWRRIDWYAPVRPYTPTQLAVLTAYARALDGRQGYGLMGLAHLLLLGHNRTRSGLYCSQYVALQELEMEQYRAVGDYRPYDFSGCRPPQPQNVDLRGLVDNLADGRDWGLVAQWNAPK